VTERKRNRFDPVVLVPLLPVVCCGLPLLAVAGIGAAALVWGGALVGGLVLVAVSAVLLLRIRAGAQAGSTRPIQRAEQGHERLSDLRAKEVVHR